MPDSTCKHERVRLIAKDDDSEYVECLDCGAILEDAERKEHAGFNESLSDA
jgi:transcription initiation factor TFIIIB Brf1 subunit/transcription initiation factor TFIIB